MPRLSDLFVRRPGAHRMSCASVWLVVAAMGAAILAAPSAAHADLISLSPDRIYSNINNDNTFGSLFLSDITFDASQFTVSGTSSGKVSLTPSVSSINGSFTQTSTSSNSGNIHLTFRPGATSGSVSESLNASVSKDGGSYTSSFHLSDSAYPLSSPTDMRVEFRSGGVAGTRFFLSSGSFYYAYDTDSGAFGMAGLLEFPTLWVVGTDGVLHECKSLSRGVFETDVDFTTCVLGAKLSPYRATNSRFATVPFYLNMQIPDKSTSDAIQQQTDDLKDTTGSDSVGSAVVSSSESAMQKHMSFMEQVDALGDMFTSISSDSDSRVTFPGISFGEIQIPPATVDIWEYMKPLETSCKTICTGVFIFAWFNGMRTLYGRIFHDEKDVIVD